MYKGPRYREETKSKLQSKSQTKKNKTRLKTPTKVIPQKPTELKRYIELQPTRQEKWSIKRLQS